MPAICPSVISDISGSETYHLISFQSPQASSSAKRSCEAKPVRKAAVSPSMASGASAKMCESTTIGTPYTSESELSGLTASSALYSGPFTPAKSSAAPSSAQSTRRRRRGKLTASQTATGSVIASPLWRKMEVSASVSARAAAWPRPLSHSPPERWISSSCAPRNSAQMAKAQSFQMKVMMLHSAGFRLRNAATSAQTALGKRQRASTAVT